MCDYSGSRVQHAAHQHSACADCARVHRQLMNDLDFKTATDEIAATTKWLRETGSPKVCYISAGQLWVAP